MHLHDKSSEVCIKTRSTPASLSFKGQVTEQTTVKWSIINLVCFGLFFRSKEDTDIWDDEVFNKTYLGPSRNFMMD